MSFFIEIILAIRTDLAIKIILTVRISVRVDVRTSLAIIDLSNRVILIIRTILANRVSLIIDGVRIITYGRFLLLIFI